MVYPISDSEWLVPPLSLQDYERAFVNLSNKDLRMLSLAAEFAAQSELRVRVGVVNCSFVGGFNRKHGHPALTKYGYPEFSDLHGELDLALQGPEHITGRTVYVARLLRNGGWALAKPCASCLGMLSYLECKRVVWTTGPEAGEGLIL